VQIRWRILFKTSTFASAATCLPQYVGDGHSPGFHDQTKSATSSAKELRGALCALKLLRTFCPGNHGTQTDSDGLANPVNDVVFLLEDGADHHAVRDQIESIMAASFPDIALRPHSGG
jgi:hypothetical protein